MSSPAALRLADPETARDLATYAARVRAVDADSGMRLQAAGSTLAAWVGVLPGQGLTSAGVVLGLRVVALAEPAELDAVVPVGAIGDRLARPDAGTILPVPPTRVVAPWAAVTPPRGGWDLVGPVAPADIAETSRSGIAEVARGTPDGAGSLAVGALRQRVWSAMTSTTPPFRAGLAFGAVTLGFVPPGGELRLYACGPWTRLTSRVGHVLTR